MTAIFHPPGSGENYGLGGSSLSLKAGAEQTGGSLFLTETTVEPGFGGPPLHIHREMHDMFYVLEGELTVQLGDERRTAGPGSFACVPPETPHTFANLSAEPVRFLNFSTPAGFESYMRELAAAWERSGGQPTPEMMGPIVSTYDIEVVGPPLGA